MSLPSKADIFEYWKDWLDKNGFDWGEPDCWACKRHWEDRYDVGPKPTWRMVRAAWNKVPLQRCHIIAKSLGGSDDVSNLFLMCRECHDLAPNTTSREVFFEWVEKQSWHKRMLKRIQEEIDIFGFTDRIPQVNDIINSEDFKTWFLENAGLHMSQAGDGTHFTISTLFAGVKEYMKQRGQQ